MTLEARQFLGDVRAVGEINHFLQEAVIVGCGRGEIGFFDALNELFAITLGDFGRLALDMIGSSTHHRDAFDQIFFQMAALAFAHFHERGESFIQGFLDGGPEILFFGDLFVGLENAGRADEVVERDFAGEFQLLGEFVQFPRVRLGERDVQVHAGSRVATGMQSDPRGQASAGDVAIDGIAHLRFEHLHLPGEIDGNFALFAVHGAQLDCDLETILRAVPAAVSRHRLH